MDKELIISKLKSIPNPYRNTPKLDAKEFIGREDALMQLKNIIDGYRATTKLSNMYISGEKSIGKSALLNRFRQILTDNNFFVYDHELHIDEDSTINEFEFIKDIIDSIFVQFKGKETIFKDTREDEIWFSLTRDSYLHDDSDYKERLLSFSSQYANYKKGVPEQISYKAIEKDFDTILNQLLSPSNDLVGVALLIDEFQEIRKNSQLLNILRMLSENLMGLIIIGAGLPSYLTDRTYEKFMRTAVPISLSSLPATDVLNIIFRPVELHMNLSRYELREYFDPDSVREIIERSGGNPLHIKILCSYMFEYFQEKDENRLVELNREVMEKVMEYYSGQSEKSRGIRLSLQSCGPDQLDAFRFLYYYSGFSLKTAINAELAFASLQEDEIKTVRNRFIDNFREIFDLNLFQFSKELTNISDLEALSYDSMAQYEYNFIGDAIDKLYASYLYEEITKSTLEHHKSKCFEDYLAAKLAHKLKCILEARKLDEFIFTDEPLVRLEAIFNRDEYSIDSIQKDIKLLENIETERDKNRETAPDVKSISKKYGFDLPAMLASYFELEGYYFLVAEISVRGKKRLISCYYPVKGNLSAISNLAEQIKDHSQLIKASLQEYYIEIIFVNLVWVSKSPLANIHLTDINQEYDLLCSMVKERRFNEALARAERLFRLDIKFKNDHILSRSDFINDFAFCLINEDILDKAQEYLEKTMDQLIISKINISYIYALKGEKKRAEEILKKLYKKMNKGDTALFLHIAIVHSKMPRKNAIVENPDMYSIICWNLALITSTMDKSTAVPFSYLKSAKPKGDEYLIHDRVRNWLEYNLGNTEKALEGSLRLLENCRDDFYLKADVEKDIEIFTDEANNKR